MSCDATDDLGAEDGETADGTAIDMESVLLVKDGTTMHYRGRRRDTDVTKL